MLITGVGGGGAEKKQQETRNKKFSGSFLRSTSLTFGYNLAAERKRRKNEREPQIYIYAYKTRIAKIKHY